MENSVLSIDVIRSCWDLWSALLAAHASMHANDTQGLCAKHLPSAGFGVIARLFDCMVP
jgi:hypothetical protein